MCTKKEFSYIYEKIPTLEKRMEKYFKIGVKIASTTGFVVGKCLEGRLKNSEHTDVLKFSIAFALHNEKKVSILLKKISYQIYGFNP